MGNNNSGLWGTLAGLIPSFLSGGAAMRQAKLESRTARYNTDATIAANRQMAEYAYSKDLEMWNKLNEYNSPEAQMARLTKAGLNPNLVYGGGANAMSQGQIPRYQAPTAQFNYKPESDLVGFISAFQDMQVRQAQVDNLRAQTEVNRQTEVMKEFGNRVNLATETEQIRGKIADWWNKDILSSLREQEYAQRAGMNPLKLEIGRYQADYVKGRAGHQRAQIEKLMADTELTKLKTDWYVAKMVADFGLSAVRLLPLSRFGGFRKGTASRGRFMGRAINFE